MKINSIKAEFYDKNKFEETSDFIKLCYEYPDHNKFEILS